MGQFSSSLSDGFLAALANSWQRARVMQRMQQLFRCPVARAHSSVGGGGGPTSNQRDRLSGGRPSKTVALGNCRRVCLHLRVCTFRCSAYTQANRPLFSANVLRSGQNSEGQEYIVGCCDNLPSIVMTRVMEVCVPLFLTPKGLYSSMPLPTADRRAPVFCACASMGEHRCAKERQRIG